MSRRPHGPPWLALATAYVVIVAAVDAAVGETAILIGLLSIGPFIAAFGAPRSATLAIGVLAVVLAITLGWADGIAGSVDHVVRTAVVATASGVAVAFSHVRLQREEALRRVAQVAEVAQRAILRQPAPSIGDVRLAARYLSATEEALIGGDLYETAFTPAGVRLIVGDVRGKGLEAVGLAARVLSSFRENALGAETLAELARAVDKDVAAVVSEEEFVTAVLVEFPHGETSAHIVNCGHHPPLRVAPSTPPSFLAAGPADLPLGMGPDIAETVVDLASGDRLLLYTDGLVEARSPRGDDFDLLAHAFVLREGDLEAAVDALIDRLEQHVGHRLSDDIALMLTTLIR